MTNPTATVPDFRALGAYGPAAYHDTGAAARDGAHYTHPGPEQAGHNEKGLQP